MFLRHTYLQEDSLEAEIRIFFFFLLNLVSHDSNHCGMYG
jgi:hypothetical protein